MEDSLLIQTYRGTRGKRPPVWFMRQAGRYLPEYRAIREKHPMLEVIRTPELSAEVTLQPIRRFGFDAAIIFADILNPLIGMGIKLDFVEGEGPKIENPIREKSDIEALTVPPVQENVGYTLAAIEIVTAELKKTKTPLIGFAGAPFTLSSYLIDGTKADRAQGAKRFMVREPEGWRILQEKLCELVTEYLVAQVEAGASAVQLFDSWLGAVGLPEYELFVEPYLKGIIKAVKDRTKVPVVFFATNVTGIFHKLPELGADVIGVDWRLSLTQAADSIGRKAPLQGNLDPVLLTTPGEYLDLSVRRIIEEGRELPGHIFNLGHGILPSTPIEAVSRVVELVQTEGR